MSLPPPPYQTAGWYTDPEGSAKRRWWNGVAWTDDFQTTASTPAPPTATGPAEQLAEAKTLLASLPGYSDRPLPTLPQAQRSVTRVVSYVPGLGLLADIFAVANLRDPPIFGILAALVVLLAYGLFLLAMRLRFFRTRTNRVLGAVGLVLASGAGGLLVLTITLGFNAHFSESPDGQPSPITSTAPSVTVPSTSPQQEIRDEEATLLVRVSNEWLGSFHKTGQWPASAAVVNGVVSFPGGVTDVSIPAGYVFTYTPTADRTTFTMSLQDASGIGIRYTQSNSQIIGY